jgi:hypothetical protein
MGDHSSFDHGAVDASADLQSSATAEKEKALATALPVSTFTAAEITGGLKTLTMNEKSAKEQLEQSRRLILIIQREHTQLQSQQAALLLLVQNRDAKGASERSGETAKSKNYAHLPYVFCGHAINDLERVCITHSGATNPAYLKSVSTYDILTQLLNENVKTQFRSAGVTIKYLVHSTKRSSLLTSSALKKKVTGKQDIVEMFFTHNRRDRSPGYRLCYVIEQYVPRIGYLKERVRTNDMFCLQTTQSGC